MYSYSFVNSPKENLKQLDIKESEIKLLMTNVWKNFSYYYMHPIYKFIFENDPH